MRLPFLLETPVEEGRITAILHGHHIVVRVTTTCVLMKEAELQHTTTAHQVITRAELGALVLAFTTATRHSRYRTNSIARVGQRVALTNFTIQALRARASSIRPTTAAFIQTPMTLVALVTATVSLVQLQPIPLGPFTTTTQKQEHGHTLRER